MGRKWVSGKWLGLKKGWDMDVVVKTVQFDVSIVEWLHNNEVTPSFVLSQIISSIVIGENIWCGGM